MISGPVEIIICFALEGEAASFVMDSDTFCPPMQRKDFPGDQFFVVFVIKPEDYACGGSVPSSIHGKLCWEVDLVVASRWWGSRSPWEPSCGMTWDGHIALSYPGSCEEE